ncbi:2-dehydropantoate 2-reductase N-terminal domain-containing protein [Jannaschia rubra]|uniref:2-dehydropantoate 2-reductase n=1 Tax=Jannaschia rubra TaxID=282197 RepID=A0A0M6XLI7_9RHOB|nr:2-dehydropantoate 2-reductase N-terminal domain-containing protein [Jannaschia rubra]CTQ31437.1 2-dehydropantoate 2-reductase [Jannaschia rubra]SFF79541.1 2-dehydropantoate 2-reductase [Jannaschia rubra]
MTVTVLGAGAIGLWVGAEWDAVLVGRPHVARDLAQGLRLTGDGRDRRAAPRIEGPEALARADLIVVAVKATALDGAIDDMRRHAKPGASVLCLLNGLDPLWRLGAGLPGRDIRAGMVPFNVVWKGPVHLHRSGAGKVAVEDAADVPALPGTVRRRDMAELQHGKLLVNLVNPVNALSGMPVKRMLSDRAWRDIFAAALSEAIAVFDRAGVAFVRAGPVPPRLAPMLLRLPDAVFTNVLLPLQGVDDGTMTSMAQDLAAGKPTEIDTLTGEVVWLAGEGGAPVNAGLVRLMHEAEAGGRRQWTAPDLRAALGLDD